MALDLVELIDSKFWTKGRLATYKKWSFTDKDGFCTPERMATAGFYFIGVDDDPDAVQCFICSKQLNGWEATDDPWQEHAKHSHQCPFILLNKQNEATWTIDELYHMIKIYYTKQCTRRMTETVENVKVQTQTMTKQIPKIFKQERKSRKGGK